MRSPILLALAIVAGLAASCAFTLGEPVICESSADCDDGDPCTVDTCDSFIDCLHEVRSCDESCNNGLFCDGEESCIDCVCVSGEPPCLPVESVCDEVNDSCLISSCAIDSDCDDGIFCNGREDCADSVCKLGRLPCDVVDFPTGICSEHRRQCIGTCFSQCEPTATTCDERDFLDYEDYDSTLLKWLEQIGEIAPLDGDGDGHADFPFLFAGECNSGLQRFLYMGSGFVWEARFFNASNGHFISQGIASDALDSQCVGISFWPELPPCVDGNVTEVFAGSFFSIGDPIEYPWPRLPLPG